MHLLKNKKLIAIVGMILMVLFGGGAWWWIKYAGVVCLRMMPG